MDIFEAIALTQDRLVEEGASMGELLGYFRNRISPGLVGEREWDRILERARQLPITMGAQPFGFELPLHTSRPEADFGVSLASGNRSGDFFEEMARRDETDETARAVSRLFREMEARDSPLRAIVGRKMMLEYDTGSASGGRNSLPGMFLRPNERTLHGGAGLQNDVGIVVDALVSCVGWERIAAERENAERVYLAAAGRDAPGFVRRVPFPLAHHPPGGHGLQHAAGSLFFSGKPGLAGSNLCGRSGDFTLHGTRRRCENRGECRRAGGRSRSDARPDAHRQTNVYKRISCVDRRPDRLAPHAGGPES